MRHGEIADMHEHLNALDALGDRPMGDGEELRWLQDQQRIVQGMAALIGTELEHNWQQQQVVRGRMYGA